MKERSRERVYDDMKLEIGQKEDMVKEAKKSPLCCHWIFSFLPVKLQNMKAVFKEKLTKKSHQTTKIPDKKWNKKNN